MSTDEIIVREATPEERTQSWHNNYIEWGRNRTLQEHVSGETELASSSLMSHARWFVALRKGQGTVISACEVIPKDALLSKDGSVNKVLVWGIASVFTVESARGKGVAKKLLEEVGRFLDDKGEASVLFSDIGGEYYARFGWDLDDDREVILPIESTRDVEVEYLSPHDDTLTKWLAFSIPEKITSASVTPSTPGFAILPTPSQLAWHFLRDRLNSTIQIPTNGAIVPGSPERYILYTHDVSKKALKVLTWNPDAATAGILIEAARNEAQKTGLEKIVFWGLTGRKREFVLNIGGEDKERTGSLSCLRGAAGNQATWLEKEYFVWC